jgi:hypothetical protein
MKRSIWLYFVAACFYFLILLVGTIFLRMNFSDSNFSGGDLVYMFPKLTWFYLVLLPIGVLLIRKLDKRLSIIIPFTFTILLLILFELVQYPSIFFWDTFSHSATTRYIINNGSFSSTAGYYEYPGTFFISAALSEVLGLSVLFSNLFFAAILNLLIIILLFAIGKVFVKTEKARIEMNWLVPTIYLVFSFRLFNSNHFSPQLFGLCLYIFLVYSILKTFFVRKRVWSVLVLVLITALTVTHVFSSLFAITTLLCICLFGRLTRPLKLDIREFVTLGMLMMAVVLFVSWHEFVSTEPWTEALRFLSLVLRSEKTLSGFAETIVLRPMTEPLLPLLGLYRYGIYGLFAFLSASALLLFRRKTEVKLLFFMGIGILLGGVVIYLTPATFGVGRALLYAGVVISTLSSYMIANKRAKSLTFGVIEILKTVLPFLVIGTFLVSNLYYSTYVSFIHQDEMQMVQFVATNVKRQISLLVDDALLIPFYANVSIPVLVIDEYDNTTIAQMKNEKSYLSLQYLPRQLYYFNSSFTSNRNSLIYSNGLGIIYAKTNLDRRK